MREFDHRVLNEDRALVETQHPEDLPIDLMAEAHIRADRSSIAYRRSLRNMEPGRACTA